MRLTLKQKQKFIEEFKSGKSIAEIWTSSVLMTNFEQFRNGNPEPVIRDYLNGKFRLPAKGKK